MYNRFIARIFPAVAFAFFCSLPAFAQNAASNSGAASDAASAATNQTGATDQQPDPLKRELPEKEKKERKKALHEELEESYKKWLNEDVVYIITPEERAAFKKLSNNEERDQFIEQFWQRRDPTPDTEENEFKEEHYRRIAYANEHFAAGKPGWKTDRGRIYIIFGKPDEIDSHPSGGTYNRPAEEGGGTTSTYPFEDWRYRYIEGIGNEVIIEFVDTCMCGDYHMTLDRGEKDALLHVPGAGLTTYEQMGMSDKSQRFMSGMETLGQGPFTQSNQVKQFDRLEEWGKLNSVQPIKLKDFDEIVSHKINLHPMAFDVRTDFVRVDSGLVLVPVTIQLANRDITYVTKDGVSRGVVNISGRVTTLSGKIVQTFEKTVQVDSPAELVQQEMERSSVDWQAFPLPPGLYRLDIVVKDTNGDKGGVWMRSINVPKYEDDRLAASTLILADKMERVAAKSVGSGNFVIGNTFVRPRVQSGATPATFKRSQRLNFWMQVYNLTVDDKTNKNSAKIEYDIVNAKTNQPILQSTETSDQLGAHSGQLTIEKSMSLASLPPGLYKVTIKVDDNISKQSIAPTESFLVE